jgi:branched-chain amino acid transport system substrate-binding protein
LALAPVLSDNSAVLLATTVASAKISGVSPSVFRNWAVENRQAAIVGQKIKEAGFKNVGVIYEETDYAKGLKIALEKYLEGSGVTLTSESFATGSTDVRTQLTKLKSLKLDALFISPQSETSGEVVLSQMEQINFKPRLFVNDIIFGAQNLVTKHSITLEGALGGSYVATSDKLQKLLSDYKARYGTDCAHTAACAVAYDSMYMLADAIKQNGDSATGIERYLKSANYQGVSGLTSFDQSNDRSGVGYSLTTIKDGKTIVSE